MEVYFNSKKIKDNQTIKLEDVQTQPDIKYKFNPNKLYTTIMFDPDAPSKANPINANYLHWLIVNKDDIVAPFTPSNPPQGSGPHRYFFGLFEQKNKISLSNDEMNKIKKRKKFDVNDFIKQNNLTKVASFMFMTERK